MRFREIEARFPFRITFSPQKSLSRDGTLLMNRPKSAVSSPEEPFPYCEMHSSISQKSPFHDVIKPLS